MKETEGRLNPSVFMCPICRDKLGRDGGAYRCRSGHSFDIAKEGYVNLLPANRKHSGNPGDDREMVDARTRFLDGGWYAPLRDRLCALVREQIGEKPVLFDAGCGEGYYTAALCDMASARGGTAAGVDLSKAAVRRASRRCPEAEIAVASVYRLPLADGCADVLVDCFSPLAAEEFLRVLKPDGFFLYVVPGPRHLWELTIRLRQDTNQFRQHGKDGTTFHFRHHNIVVVRQQGEKVAISQVARLHLITNTATVED